MGWIEDLNRDRVFVYKNVDDPEDMILGNTETLQGISGNPELDPNPGTFFELEGNKFQYAGMETVSLGIMTKIPFEKNGRKAVRTKFGDGKQVVRSATKEAYYKGKGTDSVLTKGCKEASDKVKENMIHQRAVGMKRELEYHAHNLKQRGKK